MNKDGRTGTGSGLTRGGAACGAAVVVAWMVLTRRVRALERRLEAVARTAELARRSADRRCQALEQELAVVSAVAGGAAVVAGATAEVVRLQSTRDAARDLLARAEAVQQAHRMGALQD